MKISEVLEFCDLIMAQYGNLDVLIFHEFSDYEAALNHIVPELIEVPSRLSGRSRLVLGIGFGRDAHSDEVERIKEKKCHLRLIK